MKRDDVRAYAGRAWDRLSMLERAHWMRERVERGPLSTLAASQALWVHMRHVRSEWPTTADPATFAEETRVLPFVHRTSRMPLDVILA